MTSSSKTGASVVNCSPRVMELKEKIKNPRYVNSAIQRIAQVLSRRIVEESEPSFVRRSHESK